MNDMNTELLIIFICLTIVNVIVQTIKNIVTIRAGKFVASIVSAFGYALQTVVTIYTLCDLPLWWKATIVGICNLVGVYVVKLGEEKTRKDRLWKVECTVPKTIDISLIKATCDQLQLSYNYVDISKYHLFNIYCPTKEDSLKVKQLLNLYPVKYFVSENQAL